MNRTNDGAARIIATLGLCAAVAVCPQSLSAKDREPYYGFFPSPKGADHKRFVHNIFGFSIDIPATWTFGVNGAGPTAVAFLYRDGLDTGKFSADYEVIEIGRLLLDKVDLQQAQETVMMGMRLKHPRLTMVKQPATGLLNGWPCIAWIHRWPSKTGYTVTEYVTLVGSSNGMRSLAARTTRRDHASRMEFYDEILKTFEPFKPKH